jgi:hypothetical protein
VPQPLTCQRLVYRSLLSVLRTSPGDSAGVSNASASASSVGGEFEGGEGGNGGGGGAPASGPVVPLGNALLEVLLRPGQFHAGPARVLPRALQHGWRTVLVDLVAHARAYGLLSPTGDGGWPSGSNSASSSRGGTSATGVGAGAATSLAPVLVPVGASQQFGLTTDLLPLLALLPGIADPSLAPGIPGAAAAAAAASIPPAPAVPRNLFPHRAHSMVTTSAAAAAAQLKSAGMPARASQWLACPGGSRVRSVLGLKLGLVTSLLQRLSMLHAQGVLEVAEAASNVFMSPMGGVGAGLPSSSPLGSPGVDLLGLLSPIAGMGAAAVDASGAEIGSIDVTSECRVVASSNSRIASRVLDHVRLLRDWVSNVSNYDGVAPRCHIGARG